MWYEMLSFVDSFELEQEHASLDVSDVLLKWFKLLECEFHYRKKQQQQKQKRKLFRPTAK